MKLHLVGLLILAISFTCCLSDCPEGVNNVFLTICFNLFLQNIDRVRLPVGREVDNLKSVLCRNCLITPDAIVRFDRRILHVFRLTEQTLAPALKEMEELPAREFYLGNG